MFAYGQRGNVISTVEHHYYVTGDESGRGAVGSCVGGAAHAAGQGASAVVSEPPVVTQARACCGTGGRLSEISMAT